MKWGFIKIDSKMPGFKKKLRGVSNQKKITSISENNSAIN